LLRILIEGTGGLAVRVRDLFESFRDRSPFDFVAVKPGLSQGVDLGKRERRNSTTAGQGKSEVRFEEREEERKADTALFTGFRV
jgi:hypothetical protein